MPNSTPRPTPDNRVERWKKLWGTPKPLGERETEDAFDEFRDAFVPGHMHKQFLKTFGVPKAAFGNRFFLDDVTFWNWNTRLDQMLPSDTEGVVVDIVYGSPEALEGWRLSHGVLRRSLKDIVIDDWHAACAIVRAGGTTLYVFVEPKIRGCLVRTVKGGGE